MITKRYVKNSPILRAYYVEQECLDNPTEHLPEWIQNSDQILILDTPDPEQDGVEVIKVFFVRAIGFPVEFEALSYIVEDENGKIRLLFPEEFHIKLVEIERDTSNLNGLTVKWRHPVINACQITEEFFENDGELPEGFLKPRGDVYLKRKTNSGVMVGLCCEYARDDGDECYSSYAEFIIGDYFYEVFTGELGLGYKYCDVITKEAFEELYMGVDEI